MSVDIVTQYVNTKDGENIVVIDHPPVGVAVGARVNIDFTDYEVVSIVMDIETGKAYAHHHIVYIIRLKEIE